MKKWDWWYSFQTVRVIIQSIGRISDIERLCKNIYIDTVVGKFL